MKFENDQIGSNLMLAITTGMYARSLSCLREYVQNSYDKPSLATKIEITSENSGVNWVITDNGVGMNEAELTKALGVGVYTKDYGETEGLFGIGIWSGIAVCDRLIIITKKKNDDIKLRLEISAKQIREDAINNRPILDFLTSNTSEIEIIHVTGNEVAKSFTTVRLEGTSAAGQGVFSEKNVIDYLSKNVPVSLDPSFQFAAEVKQKFETDKFYRPIEISVNGNIVTRISNLKEKLINIYQKSFYYNGKVIADCWFSFNSKGDALKGDRGFTLRHNGFTVANWERLRSLVMGRFNDRFIGEIHVDRSIKELKPVASRSDFQQNEISDALYEQIKQFLIDMQRSNSFMTTNVHSPEKKIEESKAARYLTEDRIKVIKNIEEKNFKEDLKFLDKDPALKDMKADLQIVEAEAKKKFNEFKNEVKEEKKNLPPSKPETKKVISELTEDKELKRNIETLMTGKHERDITIDPFNTLKERIQKKVNKKFSYFGEACDEIGKSLTLFKGAKSEKESNDDVKVFFKKSYRLFRNIPEHAKGTNSTRWIDEAGNISEIKTGIMALLTLIANMIERMELKELKEDT